MPICQNCHTRWSWKETIKASFVLDTAMDCPHCGKKQYLTASSRRKSGALSMIIPFPIFIPVFFDVTLAALMGIIVTVAFLIAAIQPFLLEVTDEQAPLW